jgi:hypothetical protein
MNRVNVGCKQNLLCNVELKIIPMKQGVKKGCRLSWLTNIALVYEPNAGGGAGVAGSQPMFTPVHMEPK